MLRPVALTHGHYECRRLDETLPVFTDLLAMQVLERDREHAVVQQPNTERKLVVHDSGPGGELEERAGRVSFLFADLNRNWWELTTS